MSIFYVDSEAGSDSNDGLTAATAFKTIPYVNSLLAAKSIDRGDTLAFKGGQDHFGAINSISTATPSALPLVITSYGSAERARINTYKIANVASSWSLYATNIWRIDLTAAAGTAGGFTGNIASNNVAVGFLKVDGVIQPKMRDTLPLLSSQSPAQWNFYSDNAQYLYVYSVANPTSLATDINIAVRENIITGQTKVTISNLELLGSGAHGYRISGTVSGASDIEISNCYIHEIGGSRLLPNDTTDFTRFGNGIEFWINLSRAVVEGNTISDVYDAALTCQGGSYATGLNNWSDIIVRGNTIFNCNQTFEFWSSLDNSPSSPIGFSRVKLTENTCFNAGYS